MEPSTSNNESDSGLGIKRRKPMPKEEYTKDAIIELLLMELATFSGAVDTVIFKIK